LSKRIIGCPVVHAAFTINVIEFGNDWESVHLICEEVDCRGLEFRWSASVYRFELDADLES